MNKEREREYQRKSYEANKEKRLEYQSEYRKANKEAINKYNREYYTPEKTHEKYEKAKKSRPWAHRYYSAIRRCTDPSHASFEHYGGKGIEVEMTMEDMEYLWLRDQAGNMVKASISRKDHDENYTIDNCEFIEQSEHSSRDSKGRTTPSADRKKAAREKVRIKKSVMAQLIVECGNREPTAEELGVTHRVWITT